MPEPFDHYAGRLFDSIDCWVVQTYLHFKYAGLDVHLVDRYPDRELCVTAASNLNIRDYPIRCGLVVCRHDRGEQPLADYVIVQSHCPDSGDRGYVTHWPQPGLKPRLQSRENSISRLTYKGIHYNLDGQFHQESFIRRLRDLGVELNLQNGSHDADVWRDYTQDDLALAARDLTTYDASVKPPSKLVNAWIAGCPALLGPEEAFLHYRRDDYDFFVIRSSDDVIRAIRYLKEHPSFYEEMRKRCALRADEFTYDKILARWHYILTRLVYPAWKKRLGSSALMYSLGRNFKFWSAVPLHKLSQSVHQYRAHHGKRILSLPLTPGEQRQPWRQS